MMTQIEVNSLINACKVLFGNHIDAGREFLNYLQPEGVKSAYRNRARECHPDSCFADGDIIERTELFRRSVEAYELLTRFIKDRTLPATIKKNSYDQKHSYTTYRFVQKKKLKPRIQGERYYDGPIPPIELKIGLYLYFLGVISYQSVVRALLWQRDMRPSVGSLACDWGWMSDELVDYVLSATHIPSPFGERAVKLGLMNDQQLKVILFHQRSLQKPLGRYFVNQAYIDEKSLERVLKDRMRHNNDIRSNRFIY